MTCRVFRTGAALFILFLASCKKEHNNAYAVPATYTFENIEYTEASIAVNMSVGIQTYLGKGTSRQLNQDTLNYLWNNTNNAFTSEFIANLPFTPAQLNTSGISVSGKATDAAVIKILADSMVKISQYYNTPGSEGIAGRQGTRLFNYSGFEFNQGVVKGLMGALQMAKVIQHLTAATTADNITITTGKGTAMQHEWDLAFGYLGIPRDYDSSKTYANTDVARPIALGGYFAERGKFIKAGGIIFEAFRKGRAAIAAKDYAGRDAATATIKEYLEKTMAAACYYYITHPQAITDRPSQLHELSEARGFIIALKYRAAGSKLTEANYQALLSILGPTQSAYVLMNDAVFAKLKQVQQILTTTYGQLQP